MDNEFLYSFVGQRCGEFVMFAVTYEIHVSSFSSFAEPVKRAIGAVLETRPHPKIGVVVMLTIAPKQCGSPESRPLPQAGVCIKTVDFFKTEKYF